ncbi:MAG: aquaporin, partial [Armatimonadetes bacterium]|nr:aquaporin [Armatimonadota bacterium]
MEQPWWKAPLAEFVGTFTLIFIGAGSIIAATAAQVGGAGLVGIALAHGIALGVMVSATGHISGGHINPAVTIAFLSAGRLSAKRALEYIVAQLFGA